MAIRHTARRRKPCPFPMMHNSRSAIVTVAFGHSTEHLDYTFLSFKDKNPDVPLHAFVIGEAPPKRQLPGIHYHLVKPVPDFSSPLREIYFRRMEIIDQLDVDFVLVVDSYDVLCLQTLPPLENVLKGFAVGACVEHMGSRYLLGQGHTTNFLNGGVFFWNLAASRHIRREIVERGRRHFRTIADDQHCINEILQTKYYNDLLILPCQYNYRPYLNTLQKGWATVSNLDGVKIYHNATCMDEAKKLGPVRPLAELPELPPDTVPLGEAEKAERTRTTARQPWIIR